MITGPFAVFVASSLLIVAAFGGVAATTRRPRNVEYGKANRLRLLFTGTLLLILLTFLAFMLPRLPYAAEARTPDRVVHAVGKQYAWSLTDGAGPSLESWDRDFSPIVTVRVGSAVEFRVTTVDVNHGFSLYAPSH